MNRKCIVRPPSPWEFKDPSRAAFEQFKNTLEWNRLCATEPAAQIFHEGMEQGLLAAPRRYRYELLRKQGRPQGIAIKVLRTVECELDAFLLAQHRSGKPTRFAPILALEEKYLPYIEADLKKAGVGNDTLREVLRDFAEIGPNHLAEKLIRIHGPWSDLGAARRRMREQIEKISKRAGGWLAP